MVGKTLLVRADASAEMGVGHVMRCIALAQAWRKTGGRAIFALATGATELQGRILSHDMELAEIKAEPGSPEDALSISALSLHHRADWLVVDGYHFSSNYIRSIDRSATRLLLVADGDQIPDADCDLGVNTEPGVCENELASHVRAGEMLLGPRYALLRQEFLEFAPQHRTTAEVARKILVTLGGGDSQNVTLRVLQSLEKITDLNLEVTVVAGPSNPHTASLEAAAKKSRHAMNVLSNADHMPRLMSEADLAIAGGGGTCYELAFMRVPMFLLTTANNQERAVEAYASANAASAAGWFHMLDSKKLAIMLRQCICDFASRRELAENAGKMVDGQGAARIVQRMLAISAGSRKLSGPEI